MTEFRKIDFMQNTNEHDVGEAVGTVYKTRDYDLFTLSSFNRNVVLGRQMIEQAKEGIINPIVVTEDYIIIDGQHRFLASKQVGAPIEYIVKPNLDKDDIVRMNTTQRKWGAIDHIEAHANAGQSEYIKLVNLINKKYTDVTSMIQIALGNNVGVGSANKIVIDGDFKFKNYGETVGFLNFYEEFRKRTKSPKQRNLCMALLKLYNHPNINRDRIIKTAISEGLNEAFMSGRNTMTRNLKLLLDAYNSNLPINGKKFIKYHINNKNNLEFE